MTSPWLLFQSPYGDCVEFAGPFSSFSTFLLSINGSDCPFFFSSPFKFISLVNLIYLSFNPRLYLAPFPIFLFASYHSINSGTAPPNVSISTWSSNKASENKHIIISISFPSLTLLTSLHLWFQLLQVLLYCLPPVRLSAPRPSIYIDAILSSSSRLGPLRTEDTCPSLTLCSTFLQGLKLEHMHRAFKEQDGLGRQQVTVQEERSSVCIT